MAGKKKSKAKKPGYRKPKLVGALNERSLRKVSGGGGRSGVRCDMGPDDTDPVCGLGNHATDNCEHGDYASPGCSNGNQPQSDNCTMGGAAKACWEGQFAASGAK